ncbi:uncharacterized protein LOC135842604 [Planococcus citri]|uniref:uncharacterized protein LOC135842604 n=1 Tax=Planococcus citri TaxID=170843 RepID=UPI0031F9ACAB
MERYDDARKRRDLQKIFVKQVLLNKVFVGRYTERRLIESLSKYADVIEVDQKDHEFNNTLNKVNEKLGSCSNERMISCISGDQTEGYSIFTDLSGCAFGSYWFMIKDVMFTDTSVSIIVKCLRTYEVDVEPLTTKYLSEVWNNFDYSKFISSVLHNIASVCTKENIISTFRFLSAVFLSLAVGSYELLQLLLKFFHELNNTFHICVPVLIAAIEGLTKAFGGLLIFFTYLFKKESSQKMPNFNLQNKPKYLQYNPNTSNKYASYQTPNRGFHYEDSKNNFYYNQNVR